MAMNLTMGSPLQDVSADSYSTAPSRGASAAPSRYSTSGNNSRSSARDGGLKFGFLDMGRLQHCLRLRKSFGVSDQLSGEVGLDYNLSTRSAVPQYSLAYEVRPGGSCACRAAGLCRASLHGGLTSSVAPHTTLHCSQLCCEVQCDLKLACCAAISLFGC